MNFFRSYFKYIGQTESPMIYHRWSALAAAGAMMGRQVWLPFGHGRIYPNQYMMLMGDPGARKSTAINAAARLLREAGYSRFCPDRLSKERFLMEIKPYNDNELLPDADLELLVVDAPSEVWVVAEEFTDFVGQGGMEFMTMLTKLWDNMSKYEHPKIHGKSIVVDKPTVNILGGNTVQGLSLAIPPEALGNGFMSRMIFIYAEPTGKRIPFPKPGDLQSKEFLVQRFKEMRDEIAGEISITETAEALLSRIYQDPVEVEDIRFKHYATRRFNHLLKIAMLLAVTKLSKTICEADVIEANTILAAAERRMPKALGEYGKSKHSDVSNAIMTILSAATKPVTITELFKKVGKDLTKMTELSDIMKNLVYADKVQILTIKGHQGYMPIHIAGKEWPSDLIDESFLTEEERNF